MFPSFRDSAVAHRRATDAPEEISGGPLLTLLALLPRAPQCIDSNDESRWHAGCMNSRCG
jgi:hypothetical protein